jgi:RNA-binding protein YlmH
VIVDADGAAIVAVAAALPELLAARAGAGAGREVPLERLAQGRVRRRDVVVPSLRVDAVGAKAFGVSRSWFAKGVAAGRVHVNGRPAGKSAEAARATRCGPTGSGASAS